MFWSCPSIQSTTWADPAAVPVLHTENEALSGSLALSTGEFSGEISSPFWSKSNAGVPWPPPASPLPPSPEPPPAPSTGFHF